MRRPLIALAPIAALFAILLVAAPAGAVGYWNLPGSFCQCFGYGWGAGHHASFVLGPITIDDCLAHNEVRLKHPPSPPCACYDYCDSYGSFCQPSMIEPAASPSTVYAPAPAATRPLNYSPVER
jgi:hypothetical protein